MMCWLTTKQSSWFCKWSNQSVTNYQAGWLDQQLSPRSCLSLCSDTLGKYLFLSLQPPSSGRNLEQSYFLTNISFRIPWTLLQKKKHFSCMITHEGSLKSAEESEASPKCKTSPRNTKIANYGSEKTYLTRSWSHFKMTPGRTRHHVSQGSPDTLHSFVLAPIFNWKLILQRKVQHNNKD